MAQQSECVFITGAAGMVGSHLIDFYKKFFPGKNYRYVVQADD
jgi:nucleoside-diphosphate-sugar epimerase